MKRTWVAFAASIAVVLSMSPSSAFASSTPPGSGPGNTALGPLYLRPIVMTYFQPAQTLVSTYSNPLFVIVNDNSVELSAVAFTAKLDHPASKGGSTATCGGTLNVTLPDKISFSGGKIAAKSHCEILGPSVTRSTPGGVSVTMSIVTTDKASSSVGGQASVAFVVSPTVTAKFDVAKAAVGGTARLTVILANPPANSGAVYTGFDIDLPAGLNAGLTSIVPCGGQLAYVLPGEIHVTSVALPKGGSCPFLLTVAPSKAGDYKVKVTVQVTEHAGSAVTVPLAVSGPSAPSPSPSPSATPAPSPSSSPSPKASASSTPAATASPTPDAARSAAPTPSPAASPALEPAATTSGDAGTGPLLWLALLVAFGAGTAGGMSAGIYFARRTKPSPPAE